MGVWILMMYTWDYARFGRKQDASYHAKFNFGLPFYIFTFLINGLVGIFLAATIPTEGGLSEVSVVLAIVELMGIWGCCSFGSARPVSIPQISSWPLATCMRSSAVLAWRLCLIWHGP